MIAGNTYFYEWSIGKSLLLKSSILGISVVAVFWVGWPQPPIVQHDRAWLVPVADQLTASQRSAVSVTRESLNGTLQLSTGEIEAKDLEGIDQIVLIDLNLGSRREIETLPGIGRILADRIVSYRLIHGVFEHIDDLVKVSGIGEKRFQRLQPFVTVKTTVKKRAS